MSADGVLTLEMLQKAFNAITNARLDSMALQVNWYMHPLQKLWYEFECAWRHRRSVYWPRWKRWLRKWEALEWRWCRYSTGHARRKKLLTRQIKYPYGSTTAAVGYVCLDCRAKFAEQTTFRSNA